MVSRNPATADELALHLAGGGGVKAWARARGIPERTAYRWSSSREVRKRARFYRARIVRGSLGLLIARSAGATIEQHAKLNRLVPAKEKTRELMPVA